MTRVRVLQRGSYRTKRTRPRLRVAAATRTEYWVPRGGPHYSPFHAGPHHGARRSKWPMRRLIAVLQDTHGCLQTA